MSQYPGDMRGERVDVAPRICRVFQVPPRYSLGILLVFSSTMDGYDPLWTFCPGNRGSGLPCPRRKFSQQVEALLDGDAAAGVSEVAVAVDEAADDTHGVGGALLEGAAVL